jgi:aminotransferase
MFTYENSSKYIANHVKDLPRSGIRDFFSIVSQIPEAISLGIGEPDFPTPWPIREAAIFALEQGKTSYTDNLGLIELRYAITEYLNSHFDVEYKPEEEILVTSGVSEALDIALRALLNPDDKVLYHQPCYVSYNPGITLAHGKAIGVPCSSGDDFSLDPELFISAWEPGCKAIILNFPTNPTGGVAKLEKLEKIAQFAQEKDLIVISDEIYAELSYEHKHISIATLPGMKERTVFLHGVSKAFAMTGFRIGFVCAPSFLIDAMMKVHQYSMMCAPIISQEATIEALKNNDDAVARMREQYMFRRDYIVRRFNEMGLKCHMPKASFYAFPYIQSTRLNDIEFSHRLLAQGKVAVVPGSAFGESGIGFVRASFSTSYEHIIEATNRIEKFINTL